MSSDIQIMSQVIALAQNGWGLTNPNPMVGAMLFKDGVELGRGYHMKAGGLHAERIAIANAKASGNSLKDATLYVNLEPCSSYGRTPPCTDIIIEEGIKNVVIGSLDPNPKHNGMGVKILKKAGINVITGVMESECRRLNRHFFKWITSGKPFVTLKMAMTMDGKSATQNGSSKWITGESARDRVQELRRMADAIMIGGETARIDKPGLMVRSPSHWWRQPDRIIASNTMTMTDAKEIFEDGRVEIVRFVTKNDWNEFLSELGKRGYISLLIEGGGELAGMAIEADVVDYVEFHIAPKILGGRNSKPVVGGDNPSCIDMARKLDFVHTDFRGEDIIVSGYMKKKDI